MNSTLRALNIILGLMAILIIFGLGYQTGKRYDIAVDENDKYVTISYSVNEQKMRRLMSLIDNHYVHDINTDSLVDKTIGFVMSNLDPHSVYLEKRISQNMDREIKGYYVGIGIQYVIYRDTIVITHVDKNSPNQHIFKLTDRVLQVGDSSVVGEAAQRVGNLIQGESNSNIQLTLLRENDILEVEAKRAAIPRASVTESFMLNEYLGYVKVNRFGENTHSEFQKALAQLLDQGMQSLVLDLRGNPGGIMSAAEKIADEFLTKDKLIVFTQDNQGKKEFRYASNRGAMDGQPIYVLIDEGSASASEIVAGAIQDNDAGVIIGRRSYGKGLVQREINLGDGSKLRLTTAKYFTPTGRSIQKPYSNGIEEYNRDITARYFSGEVFNKDSIKVPDSLMFKTPKGRIVYGGGGIIPDEFVPIDSVGHGRWYYEHAHQNVFNTRIFEYIENNHFSLEKIKEEHFIAYYNTNDLAVQLLANLNVEPDQFTETEFLNFKTYIKASMARFLYGDSAYNKIWNQRDPMISRAIQISEAQRNDLE